MLCYFSKKKDFNLLNEESEGNENKEWLNVSIEDADLKSILCDKKVWSNIDLRDLFDGYLKRISLVNHFTNTESEKELLYMSKVKVLATVMKEMIKTDTYFVFFNEI